MAINREVLAIRQYSFKLHGPALIEAQVGNASGKEELITCFIPGGFEGFCGEGMVFVHRGLRRIVPEKAFRDPKTLQQYAYPMPPKLSKTLRTMFRR